MRKSELAKGLKLLTEEVEKYPDDASFYVNTSTSSIEIDGFNGWRQFEPGEITIVIKFPPASLKNSR